MQSAWRHSIRTITPWCLSHFYKHSVNDTQLAARRQLSLPSLRPNLFSPSVFSSSLTLWCSAGLSLLPSSLPPWWARLRGAEVAKTHFLELVFTSFSFCGPSCAAWERLPDAQTAGEIILSFCLCQYFFFLSLLLCLQRSPFPPILSFCLLNKSNLIPLSWIIFWRGTPWMSSARKKILYQCVHTHLHFSTRLPHLLELMFTSPSPLAVMKECSGCVCVGPGSEQRLVQVGT